MSHCLLFSCRCCPPEWQGTAALAFIRDYQTGLVGGPAVFAAIWTIRKISQQIRLQKSQIDEEKLRHTDAQRSKAWAARAAMPDALSSLGKYTNDCVAYLMSTEDSDQTPRDPTEAIDVIKRAIEFVDPQAAKELYRLVTLYQIQNARLEHYAQHLTNDSVLRQVNDRLYDAIILRLFIYNLFDYARNIAGDFPVEDFCQEDVFNAMRQCVGIDEYYSNSDKLEGVNALIKSRHPDP